MHRRADDVDLVGCDRGPEAVVAIRLIATDNAPGDYAHGVCAARIGTKQRFGCGEELPPPQHRNQLALGNLPPVLSLGALALGAVGNRLQAAGKPAYVLGHDECALSFDLSFDSVTHC
jgi:hypothetical protein